MRLPASAAVLAAVALLAACGTSAPHHPALTAASLAHRIPGCAGITPGTPTSSEKQDVTCVMPDNAQVEIGTFATTADERKWVSDGGYPPAHDPVFAGCCIQGDGWAATVGFGSNGEVNDFPAVIKAIGGRQVSG